jgi:cysteinyl-tRNA synthetase
MLSEDKLNKVEDYQEKFKTTLENDLQIPQALAVVWEVVKSNIPSTDKIDLLRSFDEVLTLDMFKSPEIEQEIPEEIKNLAQKRIDARNNKDFSTADLIRDQIIEKGYSVEDASDSYILRKI